MLAHRKILKQIYDRRKDNPGRPALTGAKKRHQWKKIRKGVYECMDCTCKKYTLNKMHVYTVGDVGTRIAPKCETNLKVV